MWDNESIAEYYENERERFRRMRERHQENYELEDNEIPFQYNEEESEE